MPTPVRPRILAPALVLAVVTTVACAGTRPTPGARPQVGPTQVFAAPYQDVRIVAEVAALSCPLLFSHAQALGDSTRDVSDSIGPTATIFTVAGGIRAHGPTNELTIALPAEDRQDLRSKHEAHGNGFAIYRPDGTEVVLRASAIGDDGSRRELVFRGITFGSLRGGPSVRLAERVPVAPSAMVRAVEISANAGTRVESVMWWSGDPAKRIVWP